MKTVFIAAALVATSFAALADHNDYVPQQGASDPGKARAEVIAVSQEAKATGQINITEHAMRQAERLSRQQSTSKLTRQQVQQEVVAMREQTRFDIQGEHR
ncbi:hypothetical protein [Rhodoferax sp.]|uniref:hypothetical protein n=1 Tax=Rhodoferax sp. TaxID=50421 RepID=UPI00263204C6|nr:hypothetical protein [Rhodoferax sp.]MDD2919504.1 hypothetical protein [Rhodoferax sp.]